MQSLVISDGSWVNGDISAQGPAIPRKSIQPSEEVFRESLLKVWEDLRRTWIYKTVTGLYLVSILGELGLTRLSKDYIS